MPKGKESEEYEGPEPNEEKERPPFAQDLYKIPEQPTRGILSPEPTGEEKKAWAAREFTTTVIQSVSAMQAINDSTWGNILSHLEELTRELNDPSLKDGLRTLVLSRTMSRSAQIDICSDILLEKLRKDAKEHGIELSIDQTDGFQSAMKNLQTIITRRLQPPAPEP